MHCCYQKTPQIKILYEGNSLKKRAVPAALAAGAALFTNSRSAYVPQRVL